MSELDKDIKRQIESRIRYYDNDRVDIFNSFSRFSYVHTKNAFDGAREYVFFTRPDLNIFENLDGTKLKKTLDSTPIFKKNLLRYKNILMLLQKGCTGFPVSDSPFLNILSNTILNEVDLPSISSKESESAASIWGTKIYYRRQSNESDENHEFTLDFQDNKHLDLYMLFKFWDEYNNLKTLGVIEPTEYYRNNRILHDQIGLFKFVVDNNVTKGGGHKILHWTQMFGVFPKGVPRESFSSIKNEQSLIVSIPFKAQIVKDMDPVTLYDFNALTKDIVTGRKVMKVYDKELEGVNPDWAKMPFIWTNEVASNIQPDQPFQAWVAPELRWT